MTTTTELLSTESPGWNEALNLLRHDFYHLPAYSELEASRLDGEAVLFVHANGDQRFVLPLVLRSIDETGLIDAVSPYGYPGPLATGGSEDQGKEFLRLAVQELLAALRERRCVSMFVRLHPLLSPVDGLGTEDELVFHGETVVIDLTVTEEEMWRQIRRDHRNQIHRARRQGFTTSLDPDWSRLTEFLDVYRQSMVRVGASSSYLFEPEYFEGLHRALPDEMVLCDVSDAERMMCAGLFSSVCGIVQFHLSGTRDEFLRERPSKLMLDSVRQWAHGQGAREFHLGGGLGGQEDSLFHFKAGFSKRRAPFHTWRRVLDPDAYDRLARTRDREPSVALQDGFFPLYRAPLARAQTGDSH